MSRQWIVVGLSVAFIAPSLAQAQGTVVGFVEPVEQGRGEKMHHAGDEARPVEAERVGLPAGRP